MPLLTFLHWRKVNAAKMVDLSSLFNEVDLNGRVNLVWENGEFILIREYYGHKSISIPYRYFM